jgi:hypothetical protein
MDGIQMKPLTEIKKEKINYKGRISIPNDNYATDERIMELFEDWFDPCPLNENPINDGLLIDWKDKTYCNPPYSNPLLWVTKAIDENKQGKTIVMLLRMDTSTKWFRDLQQAGAVFLWISGRLKFGNTGKNAPFPSMLVILNKEVNSK